MEEKRLEHPEEGRKAGEKEAVSCDAQGFLRLCDHSADCGFLTGDADKSAHPQGSAKHEQQMPEYRIADVEQHQ